MNVTFRPAKTVKHLLVLGFITGLALPVCVIMSFLTGEQSLEQLKSDEQLVAAIGPLFSLLCCLLWLAYRRSSISIDEKGRLFVRTSFSSWKLDLPDVSTLEWKGKCIRFTQDDQVRMIQPGLIESADRLELIRSIHCLVPEYRQIGWPHFCFAYALPLRKCHRTEEPLEAGERRYQGRRTDVIMAASTIAGFVIAGAFALLFSLPTLLLYPCILLVVWLVVHYFEKPGQTISKTSPLRDAAVLAAWACIPTLAIVVLALLRRFELPYRNWHFAGVLAVYFAILIVLDTYVGRANRNKRIRDIAIATERWKALERGLARPSHVPYAETDNV